MSIFFVILIIMNFLIKSLFLLLVPMIFVGCDLLQKKAVNADQSREMQAAVEAERLGDIDKALEEYQNVIAAYPRASSPYLKVALIYHEEKNDYISALYNYRKYLEIAGKNKESGDLSAISNRVRVVGQHLAAQYVSMVSSGNANDMVGAYARLQAQDVKISSLEKERRKLASSNEVLRAGAVALNNKITRQALTIHRLKLAASGETLVKNQPGKVLNQSYVDEDGVKNTVKIYQVKSGDTLSRIAEVAYGNASKWQKIQSANPDKVNGCHVKPGDVLIIP